MMMDGEEEKEILAWAAEYAETHGYRLNPEEKRLESVIRGLAKNNQRFGVGYCPCRIRSGDIETDKSIVCPCIYHDQEIKEQGSCHCNLFFSKETSG
ncbi:MAG: ferredoxin:thioredoxin reductase [Methanomicrobiales archaeon]|nr:ferredoxin:thioredoxin reductase [Methanomicrobiales archaeon]